MNKTYISKRKPEQRDISQDFDLEMLYVECSRCGRPLIWEKGTTTFLIRHSGIDRHLGSDWLMLSRGCPSCSPGQDEFVLTLTRLASRPGNSLNVKFN